MPGRIRWDWYQRAEHGAKLLGDVTGAVVAEIGSGFGGHAAHIASVLAPAEVFAVDSSPAQHERSRRSYQRVPRLTLVQAEAAAWLSERPNSLDVCFSMFGAIDFTDPRVLLPAVAAALRPRGLLLFSTLGHYRGGKPAETDVQSVQITVRLPDGTSAAMARWVLDVPVWHKLLDQAGLEVTHTDTIRDGDGPGAPMTTNVIRARRPAQDRSW